MSNPPIAPEDVVVGNLADVFPSSDFTVHHSSGLGNIFFRRCGTATLLVGLKHPTALYFQGILDLHVLLGDLDCDGYIVSSEKRHPPQRVFSFNVGSSHFLSPSENSRVSREDLIGFNHCPEFRTQFEDLVLTVAPIGCVLCMGSSTSGYNNWAISFDRHKIEILPKPHKMSGFSLFPEFEDLLQTVFDVSEGNRVAKKMKLNYDFRCLVDEMIGTPKVSVKTIMLMCGGKGVGKSSSSRYLVNRLLNHLPKVLWVDFDIGQPEFTVGGCVSATLVTNPLIGPNFSHLKVPLKSYFVGDVNPLEHLDAYMLAVKSLALFCHESEECNSLPWVVNTMGYTKGLGLDILAAIISYVKPHYVIQISSPDNQDNFTVQVDSSYIRQYHARVPHAPMHQLAYKHHAIESTCKRRSASSFSSSRLREIVTVVYFADILGYEGEGYPSEWQHKISVATICKNPVIGDVVALTTKKGTDKVCNGFGIISEVNEDKLTILSPISTELFSQTTDISAAPIKFKAAVILNHLRDKLSSFPFFCTISPSGLKPGQQMLMPSLFGFE